MEAITKCAIAVLMFAALSIYYYYVSQLLFPSFFVYGQTLFLLNLTLNDNLMPQLVNNDIGW